jgi:hypothetical protein
VRLPPVCVVETDRRGDSDLGVFQDLGAVCAWTGCDNSEFYSISRQPFQCKRQTKTITRCAGPWPIPPPLLMAGIGGNFSNRRPVHLCAVLPGNRMILSTVRKADFTYPSRGFCEISTAALTASYTLLIVILPIELRALSRISRRFTKPCLQGSLVRLKSAVDH